MSTTSDPSSRRSRTSSGGTRLTSAWVAAALLAAVAALADPYPPYWSNGAGPSMHFSPVAWPVEATWIAYTRDGATIVDKRDNDPSNGGTSPQSYVNVSSGCVDESAPSIFYAYDAGAETLFFRWRVQAAPHTYATGPSAGSYAATSPWSSALWTVFIDLDGDGFRDFAVHLDGSSGAPSASIDRLAAIYSRTRSQSVDYLGDASIKLVAHNPTAFVDGPGASDRILNFQNTLTPAAIWPNGASETLWDYGTTRATRLNTACNEHFIDYQIPLAMLDATAYGGPKVTPSTLMSMFFATANSLTNPMQKDAVVSGNFLADPTREVPGGDIITPAGGTIVQPIVRSIAAAGCGPTSLSAEISDTLTNARTTTVSSATFYAYADANGNGVADDASTWTIAASGSTANNPVGHWTGSWNSSALPRGRYLIGVRAQDVSGNVTWSHLSPADVNTQQGSTPPNFANPSAVGLVYAGLTNVCGAAGASLATAVTPTSVTAGQPVTITIAVTNPQPAPITVNAISNVLPAGFTYQSTSGTGTIGAATTSPVAGASATITWTFAPVSIPSAGTRTLVFTANASSVAGTYSTSSSAVTSAGAILSSPLEIGVGSPRLTIGASASVASANPGDAVAYTITYSNDSTVNVTNAVVTDLLPMGLDFVSAPGATYNAGTRTIAWSVGSVASGSGPFTLTFSATITNPYPGGAPIPIVNTASLASTETSPISASVSTYVNAPHAQLSLQKDAPVSQIAAGAQVTYTLSYANTGDTAATNVAIADPIPAGFTFVSATASGVNTSGTVTWNVGTVAAGASGSVQVTLQAATPFTAPNPSINTASIESDATTAASDAFRLAVTQTGQVCSTYYFRNETTNVGFDGTRALANSTVVNAAETGTSTSATSTSSSNTVEGIRFYQDPAVLSQVDFSGNLTTGIYIDRQNGPGVNVTGTVYDYNPTTGARTQIGAQTSNFNGSAKGLFSFTVPVSGTLQAGHRLLWVFTFASANSQSVTLYLQYGGTATNPASGGTTAAISNSQFCTTAPANPALDLQVNSLVTTPGSTLVYTMRFANAGQTNMTGAQMINTLPAGVAFSSATLNGSAVGAASAAGQQYTFNVRSSDTATSGQITAAQSGTLVINATVSQPFTGSGDTLTDAASLSSAQTSPITDTIATRVLRASTTIAKSASASLLTPGSTVTYALDVLNSGPGTASSVTVNDVLPANAYYSYVVNSARVNGVVIAPDPVSANTLTYNLGSLPAGTAARVTYQMLVAASGAPSGVSVLDNTATVSDAGTPGTRSSNQMSVTVITNPNLSFSKTSTPTSGPLAAGATIVYTLTVTNVGNSDAIGVAVRDSIPASTSYVTGSLTVGGALRSDAEDGDNASYDGAANGVSFAVGTLAAGVSRTMTYSVRVDSPLPAGTTPIGSTATATASNASTRTATASLSADAAPVLTLTKAAPSTLAFPLTTLSAPASNDTSITVASAASLTLGGVISIGGTTATIDAVSGTVVTLATPVSAPSGTEALPTWEYSLGYVNAGTANATNVVLQDTLPAGLVFISADAGGLLGGNTVTWNLGTVAAGSSGSVRVRVRPASAGSYANTATLASAELPLVASNTTTTSAGSLIVSKATTTPVPVTSGNATTATYVITLQNQHPSTAATNVTITDSLPSGFTYQSTSSITGGTASSSPAPGDSQPTWSGVTVPAGGAVAITFVASVSNVAPGTYQNEVATSATGVNVLSFDALATQAEDVTVSATLGTTGTLSSTPSVTAGGTVAVTLSDPDLNTNPAASQTIGVTIVNARTNESESLTLTETGTNTGVFTGTLATFDSPAAGTNNVPPMNAQNTDTLTASYVDALTSTGGSATVTANTSVVTQAPVVTMTAAPVAYTENDGAVAVDAGLTVTDPDSVNLVGATVAIGGNFHASEDVLAFVNQNGITGSFNGATGVLTLTGSATLASYQAALRSVTYQNTSENPTLATRTVSVVVNDGTASSNVATRAIAVATLDDPPVVTMTAAPIAYTENDGAVAVDAGLTVADPDSVNLVGATVAIGGNFHTSEDVLAFVNQNGITGSFNGATGVLTLTGSATLASYQAALRSVTYQNTSENPTLATRTVSVVVNDGTASSNVATRAIAVATLDDPPVVGVNLLPVTYAGTPIVIDPAATVTDVDSATLAGATVAIALNFQAAEDALVFVNQNGIAGSYNAATGVLTLTGSATLATYQAALRSIVYSNSSSTPAAAPRTITFRVNDGALDSNIAARAIAIALTNLAPVVTLTPAPLPYAENDGAVPVDAAATATDADSPALASARVAIASNYQPGEDVLGFTNQNGIAGSFDAATGVLTLTGSASTANYQAALRSVTYLNTSDNPSTSARTVTMTVNDGALTSSVASRGIAVTAVNDQPTLTQPTDVTIDEDSGALVIALSGIGSGAPAEAQTLTVAAASSDPALFANPVVTYASPAATASLALTPQPDAFGSATVTVTVNDGGSANATVTRTFVVTVRPINDAPTLAPIADVQAVAGSNPQTVPLSGIGSGAANEAQTLTITAVSSDPAIVAAPAIAYASPAATASAQLSPLAAGTATITVTVDDSGAENRTTTRTFVVTVSPRANTSPTITPIADRVVIEDTIVPPVTFTIDDAETAADALTVTVRSLNPALVRDTGLAMSGGGAARTLTITPVTGRLGQVVVAVTVSDGELSATTSFSLTIRPRRKYYLAEGRAGGGFVEDLQVVNPNTADAPIAIDILHTEGAVQSSAAIVPAGGRQTLALNNLAGDAVGEVSTLVTSVEDLPLVVERTLRWNAHPSGGHAESALDAPSRAWYFADGSSRAAATAIVLANPNATAAAVQLTFLLDSAGGVVRRSVSVAGNARLTVQAGAIAELVGREYGTVVESDIPIVAERATYFPAATIGGGGDATAGVPYPASTWYFAEGSATPVFDTFLAIANANSVAANVQIVYHTATGRTFASSHLAPAASRVTIDVRQAQAALSGEEFWVEVRADRPIVAERAMYWDRSANVRYDGHTSHGMLQPAMRWATADVRVGGALRYQTYLAIANPTAQPAEVRLTLKRGAAADLVVTRNVAGLGRETVDVSAMLPPGSNETFWMTIESTNEVPVFVERSMYWSNGLAAMPWVGGTNIAGVPIESAASDACAPTLTPSSVALDPSGAAATITVEMTSRCTFTASSDASWLTIASPSSGVGGDAVTSVADANTTGATRSANVTINGRIVTITQAARDARPADPFMVVDTPRQNAVVSQPFVISGWAIDRGAARGTGVDSIDVWAYPIVGGDPVFLGSAGYGGTRPDVALLFGDAGGSSGFALTATGLAEGQYMIVAYAHSTVAQAFNNAVAFNVSVESTARIVIDAPANDAIVGSRFIVGGWALDRRATANAGIDAVHVYAYPEAGGAPVFVGAATINGARPDVAGAFGAAYQESGFGLEASGVPDGRYLLVAYAHSSESQTFSAAAMVNITVVR